MKTSKYYKQMKAIVIVAALLSLSWIYWTVGRSINTFYAVPLRAGYETSQITVGICYCLSALVLIVMQMLFLVKQMKSLKNGVLFHKSSAKYLTVWGVVWVVYDFCSANVGQMIINGEFNEIVIHGTAFGIPLVAFAFAILYRLATDVAEENNLTI